jgi:hypothetical protein
LFVGGFPTASVGAILRPVLIDWNIHRGEGSASSGRDGKKTIASPQSPGGRMHKIRVAIPAIALGLAIGSTGTAWAAPEPVAGCSNGYELMRVNTVLRTIAAPGFEQSIKDFDVNGDGYLCIKIIPNEGGPPQFDPAFLYLDNKI